MDKFSLWEGAVKKVFSIAYQTAPPPLSRKNAKNHERG
nr:MAG TPA: hypothetical protein [Caudoviricetes sp.]